MAANEYRMTVDLKFSDELTAQFDRLERELDAVNRRREPETGVVVALAGAAALAMQSTKPVTRRSLLTGWLKRT